jgi:hypothetical protein
VIVIYSNIKGNKNGFCNDESKCECYHGFFGKYCEHAYCKNNCKG